MSYTTEQEILDCLTMNFRLAAEHCEVLAWHPHRGQIYAAFREELKLVEGSCIQVANWREDTRWLRIGFEVGEAHKRAGNWLRGYIALDSRKAAHPLFKKLAENLRAGLVAAEALRDNATGKSGLILPAPMPDRGPQRAGKPVQVKTPGGIILPNAA